MTDEQIEDVQPEKPSYADLERALALANSEAERWKRYYEERQVECATAKADAARHAKEVDYAREALNILKGEYADLKERHDRAQGYIDCVRDRERPPERRMQERRHYSEPDYNLPNFGPKKTPWHSM